MKFALALLFFALPQTFAQSTTGDKLKFELARKLVDDGAPFQCRDTASELALLLMSFAGYSWNNVWNDVAPLTELKAKLQDPANKKLSDFSKTSFAFKLFANTNDLDYVANKAAAVTKALPGSIFHELSAAGAVVTYLEFQPGGSVVIHNPAYDTSLHVTGTYVITQTGSDVFIEVKFQKPAEAASYDGVYRLKDDVHLNSLGAFEASSFDAILEIDGWPMFSTDRDQTECADY